jgi:uncharacterized membrane protein
LNRESFLNELSARLSKLPKEEREAAIRYHQELFDEAGPDEEAGVLAGLGTPADAANSILSDYYGKNPEEAKRVDQERRTNIWVMILIALLFFPVILPGILTLFAFVLTVIAVAFSITVACGAAVLALILAGVAVAVCGIVLFFTHFPAGLLLFGIGLLLAGFGLLLIIPFLAIVVNLLPATISAIVRIGKRFAGRKGAMV